MKKKVEAAASLLKTPLAKNLAVLTGDRLVQLLSQLFNIFILASYLGPGNFGILLYALSIYGFLLTVSNLGLDRVLVISLSEPGNRSVSSSLVGSALLIKIGCSTVLFLAIYFSKPLLLQFMSADVYNVLQLLALNLFFSSWVVVDGFNQSRQQFQLTARARMAAAVIGILIRLVLVLQQQSFILIVWTFVAEQVICLLLALLISKDFFSSLKLARVSELRNAVLRSFRSGVVVMFSTACIVIYFRTSQGIIEQKFDAVFLGVYSLVIYIVEVPVSLSSIMATLFTPNLTGMLSSPNRSEALKYASGILGLFALAGIVCAALVFAGGLVIDGVLGDAYAGFMPMLAGAVIALPVIFIAYFLNIYMLCSRNYGKYLYVTFAGAAATLVFLFSVDDYVTRGTAVYLYVLSQLLASLIIPLVLHKPLRQVIYHAAGSFGRGSTIKEMRLLFQGK